MSLAAACGWSLFRSLLAVAAALPTGLWLARRLSALPRAAQSTAWVLLAAPLLFPPLLSGYAYSSAGLHVAELVARSDVPAAGELSRWLTDQHAAMDEVLLWLLLVARAAPVGALALTFAPAPPVSREALHCRRLALATTKGQLKRWFALLPFLWHGSWRNAAAAAGLMFLWSFQEFELASLLGRPAWPVWLFDAQAGKLLLSAGGWAAWLPALCQALVVIPLWLEFGRSLGGAPAGRANLHALWRDASHLRVENGGRRFRCTRVFRRKPSAGEAQARFSTACYLLAAAALGCGLPLALIGREALRGASQLAADHTQLAWFVRETFSGCLLSLVAAAMALVTSAWLIKSRGGRRLLLALCTPGLFGALLVGLALVKLLQHGWLNPLYRTPWSFLFGLFLLLMPRAALLQFVLQTIRPRTGAWLGDLLASAPDRTRRRAARELHWNLGGAAQFWSLGLLTWWGYLELTIASLLGPATIVSVPVLLYNQMHFGKYAIVSAMTCLTVIAPAVLFVLAAAGRHVLFRWLWR